MSARSFLTLVCFKQQLRWRVRKRHLKSEFALPQTLSRLFLELNSKGLHQSSGKENCCLVFPSSTKRKIRKFHVVVVQPRLREMYKKAWWTCKVVFFGNLSLLLLCRSRWRRCRRCLSSLLTVPNPRGPEQEFEFDIRFGLRKQPRFRDATTGLPAKWRLRNERRYSIVMTRNYPDLNSVPSPVWNFCLSFSDVISRWN